MDILLVSPRPEAWKDCAAVFAAQGAGLLTAADLASGMEVVRSRRPTLVILDLGLDAAALRKAIVGILQIDAMIHTAAVSGMSEEAFHDSMEGLGMLMGLPETPGADDARRLMDALNAVRGCVA